MSVDFIFQINKAVGTFEDKNQDHLAKNLRNIIISKPHLILVDVSYTKPHPMYN